MLFVCCIVGLLRCCFACVLRFVRCASCLSVVGCWLFDRCLLFVTCCLLFVVPFLFDVRCLLFVVCCLMLDSRCSSFVIR